MTTLENLINWFEDKNKVMIALSGGVDSALVAYAAYQKLGNSAIAVTADYKTLSSEELDAAKQICSEIGIQQFLLEHYEELLSKEPEVYDLEYRDFMNSIKTSLFFSEWIEEKKEDFITKLNAASTVFSRSGLTRQQVAGDNRLRSSR